MKKKGYSPHERLKRELEEEYNRLTEEEKRLLENDSSGENEYSEDGEHSEDASHYDEEDEFESDEENNDDEQQEDNEEEKEDEREDKTPEDNKESQENTERKDSNNDLREVNSESRKELGPQIQNESKSESSIPTSIDDAKGKMIDSATKHISENNETVKKAVKAKETIAKSAAAVKAAVSSIAVIGNLLVNPFFWVAVIVGIVLIAVISTFSIIGGNDYNKVCDSNGVGGVLVGDDVDDFTRQSAIASWLMSTPFEVMGGQPFTREQAMGIMGNFLEESYGANPKTIQDDATMTRWMECDNDCVAKFKGGGQAVGILQWDGAAGDPRRDNLVKLARQEGTQWYDLNTQLKHLKMEIDAEGDHTYENYMLKKSGFLEPGKSIEEYTHIWMKNIERCGKCREPDRIRSALEFNAKFQGGSMAGIGGSSSLSTQCIGSIGAGMVDASSLRALAESIAYTRAEKKARLGYGSCPQGYAQCGHDFTKPEYLEAKRMVEEKTGADPLPELLASCDRLVATMVRLTGIDEKFPYGNAIGQVNYMKAHPDWQQVSCQDRQPGDVFGREGHIMIYVGETSDGPDTMVSASHKHRTAHMSTLTCSGDLFHGDAISVPGWRKVR